MFVALRYIPKVYVIFGDFVDRVNEPEFFSAALHGADTCEPGH